MATEERASLRELRPVTRQADPPSLAATSRPAAGTVEIHVTIGRVVVRAERAGEPQSRPIPREEATSPSLAAYLHRKD